MDITRAKKPVWTAVLDGDLVLEVQLVDTDDFRLCIFNDETDELVYSEQAYWRYEPDPEPHVEDVARWMERANELVDDKEPPWNQTKESA